MSRTKLSTKGQVVIPRSLREEQRWKPGTEFDVEVRPEGLLLRPVTRSVMMTVDEVLGCTGYRGPVRSFEDMDSAIAKEAKRRGRT